MINLGDGYKIEADKFQYILLTRSLGKDKDGNEKEHWVKSFHANIAQCVRAIADNELRSSIENGMVAEFEAAIKSILDAIEVKQ